MGQEFIIKSQTLEDKVNQLLPSQGGFQAGVDLSASTTIIPIVDLTESAEGSNLRQDLQSAFSHNSATTFGARNNSQDIITTTGYFRIFGVFSNNGTAGSQFASISLNDGATNKIILQFNTMTGITSASFQFVPFDFIVFLQAGDKVVAETSATTMRLDGATRQIATITGELVNP